MRQLPTWIPQVPKPWNPAYHETWEAMTPNERRWSFIVDMVIFIVGITIFAGALYLEYGAKS